jgi:hypothetical protein
MTIEEWNKLRPGDLIHYSKDPSIRYQVHTLGEDSNWGNTGTDQVVIAHEIWLDPLLPVTDPDYPDIVRYDPGECDFYERAELKEDEPRPVLKPMTRDLANEIIEAWYAAWCVERSPYCKSLTDQDQRALWSAHLREFIRTKDPEMIAELRRCLKKEETQPQ